MRIGIDLDNTLVCYDSLFWRLASERGWITPETPSRKECVRDQLRHSGREADWTSLQGEVYGTGMSDAVPFPDALAVLRQLHARGHQLWIVSHRTRTPYAGPAADLHAAALSWLTQQEFLQETRTGLSSAQVCLEVTKSDKLTRIQQLQVDWFIDDLPELLLEPAFPTGVRRVLFDPHRHRPALPLSIRVVHQWADVPDVLATAEGA